MAGQVVPHQAEVLPELRYLAVPDRWTRAERVAEHEHRRAGGAVQRRGRDRYRLQLRHRACYTAKNTVSRSPCSRMSNRSWPSTTASAIRVARRLGSAIADRTG